MEPLNISEIFKQHMCSNQIKKTTKHQLDEYADTFAHEYPMHKLQKLEESELKETPTHSQGLLEDSYQFKEIDFDLESFLKDISTIPTDAPAAHAALATSAPFSPNSITIKNDKTLTELMQICNTPIKSESMEEDEIVKKDIQKIVDLLQDAYKSYSHTYTLDTFDKSDTNFNDKLKILFNTLIFKNYDFSKGAFNPESETILYKQLYKVNVYINKTQTREFTIYFGFPFYLSIRINMLGKVFIIRKNIYKLLEKSEELEKIHYYSTNTGFNILDVITAAKFIGLIVTKYFANGFDLLSRLLHTIEIYKTNSEKLTFNKVTINFKRFVKLYKQVIKNISIVPCRD